MNKVEFKAALLYVILLLVLVFSTCLSNSTARYQISIFQVTHRVCSRSIVLMVSIIFRRYLDSNVDVARLFIIII